MSHIIPFPKRTDPTGDQDFPPRKQVLAVYPGTTALYKATVVQPRKVNGSSTCVVFRFYSLFLYSIPQLLKKPFGCVTITATN